MNYQLKKIKLYGSTMEASSKFEKFESIALQAKMFILPCLHSQKPTFKEHGLITLKGVLIIPSFFCFTLRTMFNLSLGCELKNFQKSIFCISLVVLVISLVV